MRKFREFGKQHRFAKTTRTDYGQRVCGLTLFEACEGEIELLDDVGASGEFRWWKPGAGLVWRDVLGRVKNSGVNPAHA